MNSGPTRPTARNDIPLSAARSWSNQTWLAAVAMCFLLQVGLIWWCSPKSDVKVIVASVPESPPVTLLFSLPELFSGQVNPLFLSHVTKDGFSGAIWLQPTPLPQPSLAWTNATPIWLRLDTDTLGAPLSALLSRIVPATGFRPGLPEPVFRPPASLSPPPLISQPSRLRIEGELVARAPLNLPPLKDWESETMLLPTVLEVGVNVRGNVVSLVPALRREFILGPMGRAPAPTLALSDDPNGAPERYAAEIAMTLRFKPDLKARSSVSPGPVTHGRLIFEWRTIAPASTNSASRVP